MDKRSSSIGVVTWPILKAGVVPLQQLIEILYPLSSELYVITGGAAREMAMKAKPGARMYLVEQRSTSNRFVRIVKNVFTQLKISWRLCRIARHVDVWLFFFGAPVLLLPMLTARLFGKEVVLILTGSARDEIGPQMGGFIAKVVGLIARINYSLSKRIVVYSESLINGWGLGSYQHKVSTARRHFVDFERFKVTRPLDQRANLVGYVGRFSQEKGILNFMEAIPKVMQTGEQAAFLIGGDGQLRKQVEGCADKSNGKVKYAGWIPHEELPCYLNEFKLLVIPSLTEAGPAIAFEAMACGTPVLATPVGMIPDMVQDGQTGFIMENNSPRCIAEHIVRALNHPDLTQIACNARGLVEQEFTYERAVERYKEILNSLNPGRGEQ
jgi:glycosyltransferase involved in cell wall biosynthesis